MFKRLAHAVNSAYQVLISGVVTDELTGQPPIGELTVGTSNVQLVPKTVASGLFCFAGESRRLFPLLATQDASVDFAITVPGYRPYQHQVAIPAGSSFPLPALHIMLQRMPIGIEGYVVEVTSAGSRPLAYARVRCLSAGSIAGVTTALATLRTALHFAHAAGTSVQACQLMQTNQASHLASKVAIGASVLVLWDELKLAAGDVLCVGTERVSEYVVVEHYRRDAHQPPVVQLTSPLTYSFDVGTSVRCCTAVVLEAQTTLARAVERGDGLLYLVAALEPAPSATVAAIDALKIVDGDHVEYHALDGLSDESGYYRLYGIGGAQVVTLGVSTAEITAQNQTIKWMIAYGQSMTSVDFRLLRTV